MKDVIKMKDYRLYEVEDFVSDEDFIRWIYFRNDNDNQFWGNWLIENPGKHLVVAEAGRILQSIHIVQLPVSGAEIQTEKQKLLAAIQQPFMQPAQKIVWLKKWWKYAAIVVLLLSATGIFTLYRSVKNNEAASIINSYKTLTASRQNLIEQINSSAKSMKIELPDGSTVMLFPNSRFSYEAGIDTASLRNVYLSGEAFFEVAKNPKKPFRVFANEIVTKVLGTSFTVRSFENDKSITVTVRTGKVSVARGNATLLNDNETQLTAKPGGVLLTPNQQAIYTKKENKIEKILLEKPVIVDEDIKPESLLYEDAPVIAVLEQIKKMYGINITYDSDVLKNCTITADLADESLYRKMDLLCSAIGATYEIEDGEIIIQSAGCGS